jgi:O-succinylbenzoic acid--CoA ligase
MNIEIANQFIAEWQRGVSSFPLQTSGSTGVPKAILLEKTLMQWSAANTASVIHPTKEDSILCCLPCTKIGGLMMLVRALEWQLPIEIIEPIANPFLVERSATIVSLTPYQLHQVLTNAESKLHLKKTRAVIIGGGELFETLEAQLLNSEFDNTVFYHSYGMTETYSHIALRAINGPNASAYFKPFDEVKITVNEEGCAQIKLPLNGIELTTTDIISMNTDGSFKVVGRADFMINTGGVKIQPEVIEKAIIEKLKPKNAFIISSEKDEALGNKIILIAEQNFEYQLTDLEFLKSVNPYAIPKVIKVIDRFERNASDKIIRQ